MLVLKLLCCFVDSTLPRRESENNIGERTTLPKVTKRELNLTIKILVDLLLVLLHLK